MKEIPAAFVAGERGCGHPGARTLRVLRGPACDGIHVAQFDAGPGLSLRSRQLKQAERFRVVLFDAFAAQVEVSEIIFAHSVAALRRLAIPDRRGLRIASYAESFAVQVTEVDLRARVSSVSSL